ncbi:MAG: hypothetical protein IJV35_03325 [Neisseriaceae bacterium]|nr:hypothetical protein [Neisseriaceae bacterium]
MQTFFREFVILVNIIYWLPMFMGMAVAIVVVWILGSHFKVKKIYRIIIAVLVSYTLSLYWTVPIKKHKAAREVKYNERKEKYEQAKAVFDEQCKKAGEKIYRTVDNVDGVMLLKVRKSTYPHENDPMFEDAAMVTESPDDSYINSFLKDKLVSDNGESYIYMEDARKKYNRFNGYQFVDVQKEDGTIIRYSGKLTFDEIKNKTEPTISIENAARYIVTFENNVEPELRKHWVAGTTIKIIGRQTNELLAEKTIFAFAHTMGNYVHGAWVNGRMDFCPKPQIRTETRFFAEKVLKPFQLTPSFNGDEK